MTAVLDLRGRPATTPEGMERSLERARLINVSLREQLRTERAESRDFAAGVRQRALRLSFLVAADLLVEANHEAYAIAAASDRHIRQREPRAGHV